MKENPGMKRQPRRRSMQLKLNALVIGNILAVALGLMAISYYVFCQRVDDKNYSSLDRAAVACANNIAPEVIKFFWDSVNTDEFREVRDRAEKADNEQIIKDWLESKPGWDYTYYYEEQGFLADLHGISANDDGMRFKPRKAYGKILQDKGRMGT